MSDLITAGLNGKGRVIADVANHALLVLAARLMAAFGVPAAMWLFAEIWTGLEEIEAMVRVNHTEIAVHEIRLDEGERRIAVLEGGNRQFVIPGERCGSNAREGDPGVQGKCASRIPRFPSRTSTSCPRAGNDRQVLMTTIHLTPDVLAGLYEVLRATKQFQRQGLPDKTAIRFRTYRSKAERGTLERDGEDVLLSVSELSNGHLYSVIETIAHEMVHLRLLRLGVKSWDRHGARFEHLARQVCAAHGFDPKAF